MVENQKNIMFRHALFLILLIGGTIFLYMQGYYEKKNVDSTGEIENESITQIDSVKNDKEAGRMLSLFLRNPNSGDGIKSLMKAVVYWKSEENERALQNAAEKAETFITNDSLKNLFYIQLGKKYLAL